jgi:hypothetical protein
MAACEPKDSNARISGRHGSGGGAAIRPSRGALRARTILTHLGLRALS